MFDDDRDLERVRRSARRLRLALCMLPAIAGCAGDVGAAPAALRGDTRASFVCQGDDGGDLHDCGDAPIAPSSGGIFDVEAHRVRSIRIGVIPHPRPPRDWSPDPASISLPSGYGHYCSMRWPDGGWAMAWDTTGGDPCGYIEEHSDPGGVEERAGIFAANAPNRVIVRCNSRESGPFVAEALGANALYAAFHQAEQAHLGGCVMTAAPVAIPVLSTPFASSTGSLDEAHATVHGGNGFDFAQQGFYATQPGQFGLPGTAPITLMNHEGEAAAAWFVDNHTGKDYGAEAWQPLFASASGRIMAARYYRTVPSPIPSDVYDDPNDGFDGCVSDQGEVWIRHEIVRYPARYSERFVTGYMHVLPMVGLEPGDYVDEDSQIGVVAPYEFSGCASAAHLHFDVFRITNTTWHREFDLVLYESYRDEVGVGNDGLVHIGNNSNGFARNFDPYGFHPIQGFDPFAWRMPEPFGTLAIEMWRPGYAPPAGDWAPSWTP